MSNLLETAISSGAGALFGALGAWAIVTFLDRARRPRVEVDFSGGYPFEDDALTLQGGQHRYLRVKIKNVGRSTAKNCKVFVRSIELSSAGGARAKLNTYDLMQTNWVPREAGIRQLDIPAKMDFLADIAMDANNNGRRSAIPIFPIQNDRVQRFLEHVGVFSLDVVIISDNAETVTTTIRFRFNGQPLGLFAEM